MYNACLHRTAIHKMAWIDTLDDLKGRFAITTTPPSLFHDNSVFKVSHLTACSRGGTVVVVLEVGGR